MEKAKIIVTHSSNVKPLLANLINEETPSFFKVISLNQWIKENSCHAFNSQSSFYQFYKDLNQIKNQYVAFSTQCESITFAQTIYQFLSYCQTYGIDLNTLNESTSLYAQLKQLLIQLNQHNYAPKLEFNTKEYTFLLHNYGNLNHTSALNAYMNYHQCNIDTLPLLNTHIHVSESINVNQALMHVASFIIENNVLAKDVNIIFADKQQITSGLSVLHSFNIPTDHILDTSEQRLINICKKYIQFLQTKKFLDFIQLILSGYRCEFNHLSTLILYQKYIKTDNQPLLNAESHLLNKHDALKFNECYQSLVNLYHAKCPTTTLDHKEIIEIIFNYCLEIEKNIHFANQLRNLYSIVQEDINNNLSFQFFVESIDSINIPNTTYPIDRVCISDIQNPILSRKYSFIIGLTSANYPGFLAMNGLFDEQFVRNSDYPSIEKRQEIAKKQVAWILNSGESIEFVQAQNNNEGKLNEYPLFLQEYTIVKNPSYQQSFQPSIDTTLTNTKDILTQDGIIHGSISSLEVYQNCPFSYFLKSIYQLYPPQDLMGTNTLGTLIHDCFAYLFQQKIHSLNTKDQIKDYVTHTMSDLIPLFTHQSNAFIVYQNRIIDTIYEVWNELNLKEELLTQTHAEEKIEGIIDRFKLRAIVDRINQDNGYFQIVDYKSSVHSLSLNKLLNGTQLQLLTYAYLLDKQLGTQLSDLIYICFFTQSTPYSLYKISSKGSEKNDFTHDNTLNIPLKGFINGKLGRSKFSTDQLLDIILQVYHALYDRMTTQPFNIDPIEGACTYCPYKAICRFKGEVKKEREPLIQLREVNDDAME